MKSMRNLGGINRMLGPAKRRANPAVDTSPETKLDTPEENASRSVKLFCESGGPERTQGEEVLHLPTIVEAAESSPAAAKECAYQIRKFLSKDNMARPDVQYNAIMLMRILSDNPGASFTMNFNKKYIETVKTLIREGRDLRVQQILRETLDSYERSKKLDVNVSALVDMWEKEQMKMAKVYESGARSKRRTSGATPVAAKYSPRSRTSNMLPSPDELASRIEEARTSAKLLTQLVQSTPPTELLHDELILEFSDRCHNASRSIQVYMRAENPVPDNDTMSTLIETNELLSSATIKHQRAILQTRKALGVGTPDRIPSPPAGLFASNHTPPPGQPHTELKPPIPVSQKPGPAARPSVTSTNTENPFLDSTAVSHDQVIPESLTDQAEPYHPGFKLAKANSGKQGNIVGEATMHGASAPHAERNDSDFYGEEDDHIHSTDYAKQKAPVYRY